MVLGHANAAKSLYEHISNNYDNVTVEMIDCVKYVNKAIEKVTTKAYKVTSENIPWVWGRVYKNSKKKTITSLTSKSNSFFAIKLLKLLRNKEPDLIISTHAFASQMCSYLKKKNKIHADLATILTDFKLHEQWLIGKKYVDTFFVSNELMKQNLISDYSLNQDCIHVTGIPISPKFLKEYDRNEIINEFGLLPDKKNILFFVRGANNILSNRTNTLFTEVLTSSEDIQLIVVTGKNSENISSKFEEIAIKNNSFSRLKLLEFTDKVAELMYISDLVITKPGGLTVSESLASNLPLLIINPFPGQEEENAVFLEESKVGVWLNKNDNVKEVIDALVFNEKNIELLQSNIKSISKPNASQSICTILLDKPSN